jgi:hypothetical protein
MSEEERPRLPATAAVDAPAPAEGPETAFELPANFVTNARWTRTELHFKGRFSGGCWVKDDEGRLGVKKPGSARPMGSSEAFREFVCAAIACWLGVNVPPILLLEDPDIGPCSVCPHVAGTALSYADVMLLPTFPNLRTLATEALVPHVGGVVVLDAIVGAEDRNNELNHIFVEETKSWHSLDYGLSFNSKESVQGLGDKTHPYMYHYLSDMRDAARLSRSAIRDTVEAAKRITDDLVKGLVALPPPAFASVVERTETAEFLLYRLLRLEGILEQWWSGVVGLPGAIWR